MERKVIVEKKPVYQKLYDKEEIKIVYITKDGRTFNREEDAETYEKNLLRKEQIPYMKLDNEDYSSGGYFYIKTKEDLFFIIDFLYKGTNIDFYYDKDVSYFRVPCEFKKINFSFIKGWYYFQFSDGGDYSDSVCIKSPKITQKYILELTEKINTMLKVCENNT